MAAQLISVVVPTYNRAEKLAGCLAGLMAQTYPNFEVIVVDDGGTDDTAGVVKREFPTANYLRQEHAGPAAARNQGIAAARGEVVAFTDDDCLPPPGWLARLADGFARYPEAAGVGGRLLAPEHVRESNLLARYEAYLDRLPKGARALEALGGNESRAGGTHNIAYRKQTLVNIGGFDQSFPYAAGEDADLKRRITQAGGRLLFIPFTMLHNRDYTWPAFRRQQFSRGKGRVYFDRKWRRPRTFLAAGLSLPRALLRLATSPPADRAFIRPAIERAWYLMLGQWAGIRELRR